jgi:multidrug efflux pump subunit AcrB
MNSSTLTEWIGEHRRSLLFLLLLPVLAGIGAALSLPVALFPNIQFPRVRISLDAGDRPAQQMVLQVTTPVEQALLGIPRLTNVRSTTSRGASGQRRNQPGHGAAAARYGVDGTADGSNGLPDHRL